MSLPSSSPLSRQGGGFAERKLKEKRFGPTPIHCLPTELLTHIFAQLPPPALAVASLICKEWYAVVSDEGSWRSAFETYYGLGAEREGKVALGRRLEPNSWRGEYITRVSLLSRYAKSRSPSTTYSPSLGPLSSLHLLPSPSPTLLALSLPLATSALSNPFTGTLAKSLQQATPVNNLGQPLMNPVRVTAFAVQREGAGAAAGRVVWGLRDGGIRVVNSPASTSTRGTPGAGGQGEVRQLGGGAPHREGTPVLALAFAEPDQRVRNSARGRGERFVSVGQDGWVHLWQLDGSSSTAASGSALLPRGDRAEAARKVWSARLPPSGGEGRKATRVALALDSGSGAKDARRASVAVAVGMSDGAVVVWVGIGMGDEGEKGGEGEEERMVELALEGGEQGEVDTLRFDPGEKGVGLLVHRKGGRGFSRYLFPFPSASYSSSSSTTTTPETTKVQHTTFSHSSLDDHLDELTAFAFDFDLPAPPPLSLPSASSSSGAIRSFTPHSRSDSATCTPLDTPTTEIPSLSFPPCSTGNTLGAAAAARASSNQFGYRKMVVAGDKSGRVFLWDWEEEADGEGERRRVVEPRRMIQGESGSKVTALQMGEAVVLVGSLDGTLRLYCPLTSTLLRTFRDRTAPRHASRLLAQNLIPNEEEDRWSVGMICRTGRGEVVCSVGERVLSWRMEGEKKGGGGKKGKGVGQRLSARSERFRSDQDLRHQVLESLDSLTSEQTSRLAQLGHERHLINSFGLPPSLDNMTEEEAVALALMLSAEEEEGRWFGGTGGAGGSGSASGSGRSSARQSPEWEAVPEELLLEMEGLSLDSEGGGAGAEGRSFGNQFDEDMDDYRPAPSPSTCTSRSLSLSVPTSPTLRGSSLGPATSSHGSSPRSHHTWRPSPSPSPSLIATAYEPHSYASSGGSPSNMKVQLSPRLGPTYGSAMGRDGMGVREEVPDMSEELWPTAAAGGAGASVAPRARTGASPSPLVSPARSPKVQPTTAPPSTFTFTAPSPSLASSTPARRGWSEVARSTPSSSSISPSSSPAPSSPTPWSSTPSSAPRSSGLADQLRRTERESRDEALRKQEEEELRYVMELSRVEEISRREA